MTKRILTLAGDGIGHEIMAVAKRVLAHLRNHGGLDVVVDDALIGGSAYDQFGDPLPEKTLNQARGADAILFGATGGPQWDDLPRDMRPERGLLRLRATLDCFCNLRPVMLFGPLASASTLKPAVVDGLDVMIVRELVGGIYFGRPRGIAVDEQGCRYGFNTLRYSEPEIMRIAHLAFQIAQRRSARVVSVDKSNVLEVMELWREVVERIGGEYPDVELSHMYVDNAAMQLVKDPRQFDVMLTSNMFGDILSDLASMLSGSIGMLPSASLNASNVGLYEPVHGSAPDIAGTDAANPLAIILSLGMMLRYSLDAVDYAEIIESAVADVLEAGYRTADIAAPGDKVVGTEAMGAAVVEALIERQV